MKRLLSSLRIAGTGAGRVVLIFATVLLLIYLILTLFCGWSDRRFFGNIWFYHDLRYWPNVCSSLLCDDRTNQKKQKSRRGILLSKFLTRS